jgi:hypothetical protein
MHLLLKYKSGLRGNAGTASTKKEKAEKNPFPYFTTTTDFQVEPCTSTQLPPLRTKWLHRVLLILKSVLKAQLESIEHKNGFWLPNFLNHIKHWLLELNFFWVHFLILFQWF